MSAHEAEQGVLESFELLNKGTQNQEEQYAPVRMFSKTEITRKREMTAKRRLKNIFLNEESLLIILIVFGKKILCYRYLFECFCCIIIMFDKKNNYEFKTIIFR